MSVLRVLSRFGVLAIVLLALAGAPVSAATIVLVPGNGFSDTTARTPEGGNTGTTLGQQRTILFNAAAAAWGSALTSTQTIKVAAAFNTLTCTVSSGTLGSAGATSNYILTDGVSDRFYPVALAEALTAMDLNNEPGDDPNEITATFNARIDLNDAACLGNTRWYYGLTGPAPAGTFALYPVLMHELGHGLGFAAFICRTSPSCTNTSPATPYGGYFFNIPDTWSDFLRDNNIDGLGTNKRWIDMTTAERVTSFTHDPLLVWDGMSVTTNSGAQAAIAKNEARLRMYAPGTLIPGSSISHFHSDASPNLLMEPSATADVFLQTDLTDCLLADVGWINSRCATVINSPPTLDVIANPPAILEDAGPQVINLSGISDSDTLEQALIVVSISGNTALIPNPIATYTSPNATGSISYAPVANQSGSALITVGVFDDGGSANGGWDLVTRQFTVNVTAVNDTPQITSTAPTTATEAALYTYSAASTDPDGPGATWGLVSPTHTCGGSIVPSTGVFTFTPTGPTPPASCVVAVQVCDGASPNLCATQNTTVTITPVNGVPTITSTIPPTATEDTVYTYAATRDDADGPGQNWSLVASHTCNGGINPATGVFTFLPHGPMPPANCVLALQVCDGGTPNQCSAVQSATVTIIPVNSPPVITSSISILATEDTLYTYAATLFDPDGPGQAWVLVSPTHTCGGSIVAMTGVFTFTPAGPVPPATCVVAVQACDGGTPNACSTPQNTTVAIRAVNDAPVITSSAPTSATEDTLYTYAATRSDPDGPDQIWTLVSPTHTCGGAIALLTGVFTFTPAGPVPPETCVVAIRMCDNGLPMGCSDVQTTTVTITAVNDAPVISSTAATTAAEDILYTYNATRADPDSSAQNWTLVSPTHTCGGSIVAATGAFSFTPAGPTPPASCVVAVQVCDGGAPDLCSAVQSTTVTITAVNDAPVVSSAIPTTATEDTLYTYAATRSDPDGPHQIWSLITPTHTCGGSIVAATGAFSFTPAGPTPPASCVVAVQVCDGATTSLCSAVQSGTVTIIAVNDAPGSTAPGAAATPEDTLLAFSGVNLLGVTDADSATLQVALTVDHGTLSLASVAGLSFSAGDGTADASMTFSGTLANLNAALATLSFSATPDWHGSATLAFTTTDGVAAAVVRSIALSITAVPDVADDAVTTTEEHVLVFNAVTGADGGAADDFSGTPVVTAVSQGTQGAVSFLADGTLTYTPATNANGSDAFTYTVSSGGVSETGHVSVTIVAVNDAPTLNAIANPAPIPMNAGLQNIALSGIGAGGDETGQTLTVAAVSDNPFLIPHPGVSYVSPGASGSLSFAPIAGQHGSVTISVTVTDSGGTSNGGVNAITRTFVQSVIVSDRLFANGFEP